MQKIVNGKVLVELTIENAVVDIDNELTAYDVVRSGIMDGAFIDFSEDRAVVKSIVELNIKDNNQVEFKEFTNLLEKIAYKLEKVFEHLRLWARYEGECGWQ